MDNLTKLTEKFEAENPVKKAFTRNFNKYGNEQPPTYTNGFVLWLASRPTCGKEQRKFLDEIKEKLVNNQKDIPQDVADIINKRFMDLF